MTIQQLALMTEITKAKASIYIVYLHFRENPYCLANKIIKIIGKVNFQIILETKSSIHKTKLQVKPRRTLGHFQNISMKTIRTTTRTN